MKIDRLKELMAKPNMDTTETGEYLALVRGLLPGLLRVCDAYRGLLVSYAELDASRFGVTVDGSVVRWKAIRKLEELLG